MRCRSLIILILLCVGSPLFSENTYDSDLSVTHLDLHFRTDFRSNSVWTLATLSLENFSNKKIDTAEFFVCPGMNDPDLRADISHISIVDKKRKKDLAYTIRKIEDPYTKGNEWKICTVVFEKPIEPGEKFGLEFEYTMIGKPDHSSTPIWKSQDGIKELFLRSDFQWCPTLYVPTESGVIPNLHAPTWTLRLEYPSGYVGVADGRRVRREEKGGVIKDTWKSLMNQYPQVFISTYKIEKRTSNGFTLEFYAPDVEVLKKGAELFDTYAKIFNLFVSLYGHPGHRTYRFIGSPVHKTGNGLAMGLVVPMNSLAMKEQAGFVAHEMAHTWWGWLAPTYGEGSKFLREALAEFSSLWAARGLKQLVRSVLNTFDYDPRPIQVDPEKFWHRIPLIHQEGYDPIKVINANYQKGPLIVNQLRLELGDKAFFKALRTFIDKFRKKGANIYDFIETFNTVTGKDQTQLFKDLLWSTGYPIYRLIGFRSEKRGNQWLTNVTIKNEGDFGLNCPLLLKMGDEEVETLFKLGGKSENDFRFETSGEVKEVIIDPDFIAYQYSPDQKLRFWTIFIMRGGRHWAYFWKSYALFANGDYQKAVEAITEFFAPSMKEMGANSIEELSRTRKYPDAMYFLFMRGFYCLGLGDDEQAEKDIKRTIPFLGDYLSSLYRSPGKYIIKDLYADGILPENKPAELVRLIREITGHEFFWDESLMEASKQPRIEEWKGWWEKEGKYRKLNLEILKLKSRPK